MRGIVPAWQIKLKIYRCHWVIARPCNLSLDRGDAHQWTWRVRVYMSLFLRSACARGVSVRVRDNEIRRKECLTDAAVVSQDKKFLLMVCVCVRVQIWRWSMSHGDGSAKVGSVLTIFEVAKKGDVSVCPYINPYFLTIFHLCTEFFFSWKCSKRWWPCLLARGSCSTLLSLSLSPARSHSRLPYISAGNAQKDDGPKQKPSLLARWIRLYSPSLCS